MAEDRLRCPFYFKTGVCRHGIHCRYHHKRPTISRTLLLSNMYQHPNMITPGIDAQDNPIDPGQIQEHFENFYEDIFKMLSKYGEIKCLNVCDNIAKHMIGNVYVQFRHERQAQAALRDLQGRLYNWRPIKVEYSPSTVTKFFYSTCLLFEQNSCERGSYCNFLHVKKIGHKLMRKLFGRSWRSRYSRIQSRNPSYRRDRESRKRSHERGDHREHERTYERRSRMSRYSRSRSPSFRRDRESRVRSHERGDHSDRDRKRHERRYERRSRRLRYSRSRSRSRSPSYRRDRESREKSHERGDHRERDWIRHEKRYERMSKRSRYSRSQSRSPSYRRDRESRERSHERGDHRERDWIRHERRYERMSRRSRYSRSRSPSYRRDIRESRERSHERGDHRRSNERDRDRERHERRSERR